LRIQKKEKWCHNLDLPRTRGLCIKCYRKAMWGSQIFTACRTWKTATLTVWGWEGYESLLLKNKCVEEKCETATLTFWGREGYESSLLKSKSVEKKRETATLTFWEREGYESSLLKNKCVEEKCDTATLTFWGREGYESSLETEILCWKDHCSEYKVDLVLRGSSIFIRPCIERAIKKMWDQNLVSRGLRVFIRDHIFTWNQISDDVLEIVHIRGYRESAERKTVEMTEILWALCWNALMHAWM